MSKETRYFDSESWKKGVRYVEDHRHSHGIGSIRLNLHYFIHAIHEYGHCDYTKDDYNYNRGFIDSLHYNDSISLLEMQYYQNVLKMLWYCKDPTVRNRTYTEKKQHNTF